MANNWGFMFGFLGNCRQNIPSPRMVLEINQEDRTSSNYRGAHESVQTYLKLKPPALSQWCTGKKFKCPTFLLRFLPCTLCARCQGSITSKASEREGWEWAFSCFANFVSASGDVRFCEFIYCSGQCRNCAWLRGGSTAPPRHLRHNITFDALCRISPDLFPTDLSWFNQDIWSRIMLL